MGKKKGKKSAALKALKAIEDNRGNEDLNSAAGSPGELEQNSQSLDDLNATAEELNRQENNSATEEANLEEQFDHLKPGVNLDSIDNDSGQHSPEVKPLFAYEVAESPLDHPKDTQPKQDVLVVSLDPASQLKSAETEPLRIRKPDTPVGESPTKEQEFPHPSSPRVPLPLAETPGNETPSSPECSVTMETKAEDHPGGITLPRRRSLSISTTEFKPDDHPSRNTSPHPIPVLADGAELKTGDHSSRNSSRPVSPLIDTTEFESKHHPSRAASPRPKPPLMEPTEIKTENRPNRTASPRPKPPPLDSTSSDGSQLGAHLGELTPPQPVPRPTGDTSEEVEGDLGANSSLPVNPKSTNEISRKESQLEANSSSPVSQRPLPPLPVGLSFTKRPLQEKGQSDKPPPLPSRSSQATPSRAMQAGGPSDEETDEVPGLRSFHRTPAKTVKAPITDTMGLNTVSPRPFESSIDELSEPKTAEMIDVDLNESAKENQETLATPAKLTISEGTIVNDKEKAQSHTLSQTFEPSTVGSGISHTSPKMLRAETQSPISPPLPARGTSTKRYAVPPPLEQEMRSKEFRKNLSLTRAGDTSPKPPPINRAKRLESAAEINLIANRLRETTQYYQTEDATSRENIEKGQSALKSSFSTFLESLPSTPLTPGGKFEGVQEIQATPEREPELGDDELNLLKTDWSFWTQVVNDFPSVAGNPEVLEKKITEGIPEQVRGIIWQLIANSKSVEFEDIYQTVRDADSPHENSIRRDMKRTKFIPESKFESLFNVIKVYSVFDPDVGYTQGMAFIVTPLLLNTQTEAEAFGLLVRLMKNYGLRNLYLPEMPGLMLMLYQFDRLLEENSPQLYNHLARQGVRSSMYATQWFLTFFAYKFPLEFVLRIYDIVFVEGVESFLKFAVNLMIKNIDNLLDLQFDRLLDFLKEELFYYYLKTYVERRNVANSGDNENGSVLKREITSGSSSSKHADMEDDEYDVDQFVCDAMNDVHITPISLRRYTSEYDEIHEIEQQKEAQYESIRIKNQQLQKEVRKLEHGYTLLNREHVDIANELIKNRLKIETLSDENNDMKSTILDLKRQLEEHGRRQTSLSPDEALPNDIRQDLNRTIKRNAEVMSENLKLQDKITELERTMATLRTKKVASAAAPVVGGASHVPREKLSNGWSGLKKVFK